MALILSRQTAIYLNAGHGAFLHEAQSVSQSVAGTLSGGYTQWSAHLVVGTLSGRHTQWLAHSVVGTLSGWQTQ